MSALVPMQQSAGPAGTEQQHQFGQVRHALWLERLLPRVAATIAMLLGFSVLLGWALDIETLKSLLPHLVSMKPNTAMSFVLAGACFVDVGTKPIDLSADLMHVLNLTVGRGARCRTEIHHRGPTEGR